MTDLDLEPEHIAQLALERGEIGIDLVGLALHPATDVPTRAGPTLFRKLLGLAHAEPIVDDLPGQPFGLVAARDRPRMAHHKIASH